MLGRLRDAVADVRDAGSNATRWLGIDEAAAYMGSGNEKWRIVGARNAVAEEPELECNAAAVECSISGAVRGHAALQALEQFAAARQASHARGEWSSAAAPLADAATARPRRSTRASAPPPSRPRPWARRAAARAPAARAHAQFYATNSAPRRAHRHWTLVRVGRLPYRGLKAQS